MNNKPIKTYRDGSVQASIWQRNSDKGVFYSVEITRSYKDKSGNWQNATSFSGADTLVAANLLRIAHNWVLAQRPGE